MDLSVRMRTCNNVKHIYATFLKSGGIFFTFITMLLPKAKASICSTIKENLLLYYLKFSAFVILSCDKNTACDKIISFTTESLNGPYSISDIKFSCL